MGQKLVTVQFRPGSSSDLWNPEFNPTFNLKTSSDSLHWEPVLTYYPKLAGTFIGEPIRPGATASLTSAILKRSVQKKQKVTIPVDDDVKYWQVIVNDLFLTAGQDQVMVSGSF